MEDAGLHVTACLAHPFSVLDSESLTLLPARLVQLDMTVVGRTFSVGCLSLRVRLCSCPLVPCALYLGRCWLLRREAFYQLRDGQLSLWHIR